MIQRASSVNPSVLVWARERAGLSVAEVAERLGKAPELIASWERGEAFPAYGQLERLAETLYKRPVALFFLPSPPEEPPVRSEFRTLPDADLDALGPDTRYALRDAHAFQASLRELSGGRNPAERLILRDIRPTLRSDIVRLARESREYLGVSLEQQLRWPDARRGMDAWRTALERVGVFVFKRSFADRDVSGFCLHDDLFPIIVVNNSTPFTRQTFTLLHELGHLLYGVSSMTTVDQSMQGRLSPGNREVEMACNRYAAEALVPDASFPWSQFQRSDQDSFVEEMAERYSLSREVILRKLRDRALVTSDEYATRAASWVSEPARENASEEGGGSYYATQSAYLSRAFVQLAFAQLRSGRISLAEMSEHLRMRARNIAKFEDFLSTTR